jgi:hypothetical protein
VRKRAPLHASVWALKEREQFIWRKPSGLSIRSLQIPQE